MKAKVERNEEMRRLYQSGMTLTAVGAKLGVSSQRVHQVLTRLGVKTRGHSRGFKPDTASKIAAMFKGGVTSRVDIARKTGLSMSTVSRFCAHFGIPRERHLSERTVLAMEMFDRGMSIREIARALGYQEVPLRVLLHRNGRTIKGRKKALGQNSLPRDAKRGRKGAMETQPVAP